jgi:hypothetical protein
VLHNSVFRFLDTTPLNPVYISWTHLYFSNIHFNIILLSVPRSAERYFSSQILRPKFCIHIIFSHTCYRSRPSYPFWPWENKLHSHTRMYPKVSGLSR